jgi:hypothetical protein
VALLSEHCREGRLTLDEFSERVGAVFAARYVSDLEAVTRDLPAVPAVDVPASRRRASRWVVAVMGQSERTSRWRAGERIRVVTIMGNCRLDLRRAEIDTPEVVIRAFVVMGGIDIIVPEGVEVELTGIHIMGDKNLSVADVPRLPGTPLVKVKAIALMGGVKVRSRDAKREAES